MALAGAVLVVVVVVGMVVAFSGRNSNPPRVSYPTVGSEHAQPIAPRVLQRPQTSRDRTLSGVVLRAGRLGGFPKQAAQDLEGLIPSTIRYAQTLP